MIHRQELEDAIAEMQGQRDPNANTCYKLAAYYVIRDHMEKGETVTRAAPPEPAGYSGAAEREEEIPAVGDTEFMQTISGMPTSAVLAVMDDCMTALKTVYPRLYHATLRKLRG